MKQHARLSLPSLVFFLISLCTLAASALAEYPASFASTFSLAEHSACKEVVLQLKDGATTAALENRLHALTQDIFPYQMEVTNGYQHGFFLEVLRGYAAMQNDNPPVAYRHFNNALLYYDEDAVFGHTEPLAEIYCAIGETCVAVGRYMDAKDWLDTAFLEAGDNTRIQANVLRASIRLGRAIGDFPDIILSYQYLQSIDTLNRDEIADYAQVLFLSRKDREGFGQLLRGIAAHGIDNDLGVRDPLVHSFLNNIMRADDSEVRWFYDLLGWSITDARAKEGDERYLAFLLNARTLFRKVYDFLEEEDDLEKVRERIDMVKEQLAAGYDVFGESAAPIRRVRRRRRVHAPLHREESIQSDGSIAVTPSIAIEDTLMHADWRMKTGDNSNAHALYADAVAAATGTFAHMRYDGTTAANAAVIGLLTSDPSLAETYTYVQDDSFRAIERMLRMYPRHTTDFPLVEYTIERALSVFPLTHSSVRKYIRRYMYDLIRQAQYTEVYRYAAMIDDYSMLSGLYSAEEKENEAFDALLDLIRNESDHVQRLHNNTRAKQHFSWASNASLKEYENMQLPMLIYPLLRDDAHASSNTREAYQFASDFTETYKQSELDLRNAMSVSDYATALNILTTVFHSSYVYGSITIFHKVPQYYDLSTNRYCDIYGNIQAGHEKRKAICLLRMDLTNQAYKAVVRAYKRRCYSAGFFRPHMIYPTDDMRIIEECVAGMGKEALDTHITWLEYILDEAIENNALTYIQSIKESIAHFITLREKEYEE